MHPQEHPARVAAGLVRDAAGQHDPEVLRIFAELRLPMTKPLFEASKNGDEARVRRLLEARPALAQERWDGVTPLFMASQDGHVNIVTVLLIAGADVNRAAGDGATPLYIASESGHTETVKVLRAAGADFNLALRYKVMLDFEDLLPTRTRGGVVPAVRCVE